MSTIGTPDPFEQLNQYLNALDDLQKKGIQPKTEKIEQSTVKPEKTD